MTKAALAAAVRASGPRIVAALAARFRDLDLAEDAFADACARAADLWPQQGVPTNPAAWLYRVSDRCVLQTLRWRKTRAQVVLEPPLPESTAEDALCDDTNLIPDERLRLMFICCHPAVAPDSRAALTLRLVCGLSTSEIADAFLVPEPTLAQRLVRAKRKITKSGIPFDLPGPSAWPERMEAVLSTLEIVYAKAHQDASGTGRHAGYAAEMLTLTALLAELVPGDARVVAFASLVRYAEARRPARLDNDGAMTPLSEQDPLLWDRHMIAEGDGYFDRAVSIEPAGPSVLQAALHRAWCARTSRASPPPWPKVLAIYDALLEYRDDPIVRLNRAVALAEVAGPELAMCEVNALDAGLFAQFGPYHAVRAELFRRLSAPDEAIAAYELALSLGPPPAEKLWLERVRGTMRSSATPQLTS
jgi:RNA polymerase sigma-70 factor (ECF subfamily)